MPAEYLEPVDVQEPVLAVPQNMIPPHNGIGSELDSLQNCISLIPKAQTKDFQKLMNNDGKVGRSAGIPLVEQSSESSFLLERCSEQYGLR